MVVLEIVAGTEAVVRVPYFFLPLPEVVADFMSSFGCKC